MKTQELILICRYAEEGQTAAQIIAGSFTAFLKNKLQNIKKDPPPAV